MKSSERSFKVLPRWNIFVAVIPAVVFLAAAGVSLLAVVVGQWPFLRRFWPMLTIAAVGSLVSLRPFLVLSHTIVLRESEVAFLGLRREFVVRKGEAISLKPATGVQGTFELRSDRGRASFFSRFTGFHLVVAELKAQNPAMTIEGC
jgi:hypothetical protein